MILAAAIVALVLAAIPALMVFRNRALFQRADFPSVVGQDNREPQQVSVLIPARDEAEGIAKSVKAALHSQGIEIEVVVLDDASTDATPDIIAAMAQRDPRVRLIHGRPLPPGWNGKQHACWQLAEAAKYSNLLFIDADVRLSSDAIERLLVQRDQSKALLLSAFPYQETETFWEKLLIPMMHFILLGFLPLDRMRASSDAAFAAGCGQLFLTDAEAYRWAGTHEAIRGSRHDGLKLPRAYRERKLFTDICDGTDIATCRMYKNAGEVFRGLQKNATEGIANPKLIVPFSILLLGGSVLPIALLPFSLWLGSWPAIIINIVAVLLAWLPRLQCAIKFGQAWLGVALHPLAVATFVFLQWTSLIRELRGKKVAWRGRTES